MCVTASQDNVGHYLALMRDDETPVADDTSSSGETVSSGETSELDVVVDELFFACGEWGDLEAVKLLVDSRDPDLDAAQKDDGCTALEIAATYGHDDIVKFLLDRDADVNKKDFEGWTPLHASAAKGHMGICLLLCGAGADLSIKNYDDELIDTNHEGLTPAAVAFQRGHMQVMNSLDFFANSAMGDQRSL
jgi:ankyrin repeat protein